MSPLLSCRNFTKAYPEGWFGHRGKPVFEGLDLTLEEGEIRFLLGINGAGKTTLLKCLSGLLVRDSGELTLGGRSLQPGELPGPEEMALVQADERSFYQRLTVKDNLDFFAAMAGLGGIAKSTALRRVKARLHLDSFWEKRFHALSSGQKQRVALARGLLIPPRVLLLDEPTRSLDPLAAEELRQLIGGLVTGGEVGGILFSTHTPLDLGAGSGPVMLLDHGDLGLLEETQRSSLTSLEVHFRELVNAPEGLPLGCTFMAEKEMVLVPANKPDDLARVLTAVKASGGNVERVSGGQPDLESWLETRQQGPSR